MNVYALLPSNKKDKKWMVITPDGRKIIHFGNSNYQDYTQHHDKIRMNSYILRHQKRENWTKSGINTAGWWSRWLLWSAPSISAAIKLIKNKFDIDIIKI
jgi:Family of unknown function (DUF5754)